MSEPNEPTVHARDSIKDSADSQAQPEISQEGIEVQQEEEQQLRKSKRKITLTDKGREMQVAKIKSLQQRFISIYNKWKTYVKSSKRTLSQPTETLSDDLLNDVIGDVRCLSADVQRVYDELRKISTPEQEIGRRVDFVWRFLTSLYLEPQVDCKEGLQKEKIKISQKQALSSCHVRQVSQVLSLLSWKEPQSVQVCLLWSDKMLLLMLLQARLFWKC